MDPLLKLYILAVLMKQVFHKTMSLCMALVVLCSTMSFTINMHYCGDTLVETVVFKKTKGCGMEMQKPTSEGCAITKKNCCDDQQLIVEGQDELQLQMDKLSFEQQLFITSFFYAYSNRFEDLEKNLVSYKDYKPPRVIRRLFKLDESYLI